MGFVCDRRGQAASGVAAVADGVLPAQRGALGVHRAEIAPVYRRRARLGRGCGGHGSGISACHIVGDPISGRRNAGENKCFCCPQRGGGVSRQGLKGACSLVHNAVKQYKRNGIPHYRRHAQQEWFDLRRIFDFYRQWRYNTWRASQLALPKEVRHGSGGAFANSAGEHKGTSRALCGADVHPTIWPRCVFLCVVLTIL